jgi:DNA-binding response OmpR family regulator
LPREEQLRRLDVLIVESDDGLAKLLMNALETRGYVARWIPDGRSAIASLIGEPPSLQPRLVLLDIDLPDMGGLGVLRRIHGEGKLESLDVVMLTGRSAELEMIKALELGASDHIAKPFSVPELVEKVRQAIGSL